MKNGKKACVLQPRKQDGGNEEVDEAGWPWRVGYLFPLNLDLFPDVTRRGWKASIKDMTHDLTYSWRRPFWLWCEQVRGAGAGAEAERGVEALLVVLGWGDGVASGIGWGYCKWSNFGYILLQEPTGLAHRQFVEREGKRCVRHDRFLA